MCCTYNVLVHGRLKFCSEKTQITITLVDPDVQINIQTYDIFTSNGGKRRPSLNEKIEHEESCSRDHAGHTHKASRISKAAVDNCGKGVDNFYLS